MAEGLAHANHSSLDRLRGEAGVAIAMRFGHIRGAIRYIRDRARAIYSATTSLPEFPSGTFNCPIDFGVRYQLTFHSGGSVALVATLSPGGCGQVWIEG